MAKVGNDGCLGNFTWTIGAFQQIDSSLEYRFGYELHRTNLENLQLGIKEIAGFLEKHAFERQKHVLELQDAIIDGWLTSNKLPQ